MTRPSMVDRDRSYRPTLDAVARDIDPEIARLELASMDVQIDDLTFERETYLSSVAHGA